MEFLNEYWPMILLAVSELLAVIPFFKSNSIGQLILNMLKALVPKKEPAQIP